MKDYLNNHLGLSYSILVDNEPSGELCDEQAIEEWELYKLSKLSLLEYADSGHLTEDCEDSENLPESAYYPTPLTRSEIVGYITGELSCNVDMAYIVESEEVENAIQVVLRSPCSEDEIAFIYKLWSIEPNVISDFEPVLTQMRQYVRNTASYGSADPSLLERYIAILGDDATQDTFIEMALENDNVELLELCEVDDVDEEELKELYEQASEENAIKCMYFLTYTDMTDSACDLFYQQAILKGSSEALLYCDVPYRKKYIKLAVRNQKLDALSYFAIESPVLTADYLIKNVSDSNPIRRTESCQIYAILWRKIRGHHKYSRKLLDHILSGPELFIKGWIEQVGLARIANDIAPQRYAKKIGDKLQEYFENTSHKINLNMISASTRDASAINRLLCWFPVQLERDCDPDLLRLRCYMATDNTLKPEDRRTSFLIGAPLSSMWRLYPGTMQSPYFKVSNELSEFYTRSACSATAKALQIYLQLKKDSIECKVMVKQKGKSPFMAWNAHTGQYANPIEALARGAIGPAGSKQKPSKQESHISSSKHCVGDAYLYTALLKYRLDFCRLIADKMPTVNHINVKFANDYPCMMVFIALPTLKKKPSAACANAWTQLIMCLLIPLLNKVFMSNGYPIEVVARASFGFLTPTLSAYDQSIRINLGLLPQYCVELIVGSLKSIDEVLSGLYSQQFTHDDWPVHVESIFLGESYQKYFGPKAPKLESVFKALWIKVERGDCGRKLVQSISRTAGMRQYLVSHVTQNIDDLSTKGLIKAWMQSLSDVIKSQFKVTKRQLSAVKNSVMHTDKNLNISQKKLNGEDNFFSIVAAITQRLEKQVQSMPYLPAVLRSPMYKNLKELKSCVKNRRIQRLYYHFEMVNELLFACAPYYAKAESIQDGEASDSDDEIELEAYPQQTLFGKKYITHNGMRSIWAAITIATRLLNKDKLHSTNEPKIPSIACVNPYYELANTLQKWAEYATKCDVSSQLRVDKKNPVDADILFADLNACETCRERRPALSTQIVKNTSILIVDTTSSLPVLVFNWLKLLFEKKLALKAVICVASGLKEQQLGADKNHYGVIRIFSRNKKTRDEMMAHLAAIETPLRNRVAQSHRKLMKLIGCVPASAVFFPQSQRVVSDLVSPK